VVEVVHTEEEEVAHMEEEVVVVHVEYHGGCDVQSKCGSVCIRVYICSPPAPHNENNNFLPFELTLTGYEPGLLTQHSRTPLNGPSLTLLSKWQLDQLNYLIDTAL
jgi:hypothetical protein